MKNKPLFMETTEIAPEKTAGEIVSVLVGAGATQISTEYANGTITGLRWIMRVNGMDALFAMPARLEPIFTILAKRQTNRPDSLPPRVKDELMLKARRVAWRQLLRWTQAQLAMIECGMTEAGEVFFPYLQHPQSGRSVFDHFKESGYKALPAPEGPTQ